MEPKTAIIDITSKCNLKCSHCYNQERYWENQYPELTKDQLHNLIINLKEMKFNGIHLLGGEPLLAENLLYIIQIAQENNLSVSIVTNGTLLTKELMRNFCKFNVESIGISLEGTSIDDHDLIRGNGTFNKVIENVKEAVKIKEQYKSDLVLGISFTLTKKNCINSTNILDFANEIGFDGVSISYLSNEGKARDNYNNLAISEKEKFHFIDEIMKSYESNNNLILNIDARGYLGEYIYKKHGIRISTDTVGCKGAHRQFYVTVDGKFLPCSPSGTSMSNHIKKSKVFNSNPLNIFKNSVNELKSSHYLIDFYNYAHNYRTYENLVPCRECKYNCKPCPLLYTGKNLEVKECLFAVSQIKKLELDLLKKKYKKSPLLKFNTYKDTIEIINMQKEEYIFILDGISLLLWNKIEENKNGLEILQKLHEEFKEQVFYDEIKNDFLEFIYELIELDIIYTT